MNDLIEKARSQKNEAEKSEAWQTRGGMKVTVFKNGFQLEGGSFREISGENEKQFLEDLKEGLLPEELEEEVDRRWGADAPSAGVVLVNRSEEVYLETKAKESVFQSSAGHKLTGSTPLSTHEELREQLRQIQPRSMACKQESKVGLIQISLFNGNKLKVYLPTQSTVQHLYQHVSFVSGEGHFVLYGGFPPREIVAFDKTLLEENIFGATVTQRRL